VEQVVHQGHQDLVVHQGQVVKVVHQDHQVQVEHLELQVFHQQQYNVGLMKVVRHQQLVV
jgi:ribosomal protein L24